MSKRIKDYGSSSSRHRQIKNTVSAHQQIAPVSTLEQMDIKALQFKNKKLAEKLDQQYKREAELRTRIETLENRQTKVDSIMCVMNRHWNVLNEDMKVILQRFDVETAVGEGDKKENKEITSFLMQLSTWDKEELNFHLTNRVQGTKDAIAKVLQVYDRLQQKNDNLWKAVKGKGEEGAPALNEVIRATNEEVTAENSRLQSLSTILHKGHHAMTLNVAELQDVVNRRDTENAQLLNQIEILRIEISKVQSRNITLELNLAGVIENLNTYNHSVVTVARAPSPTAAHSVANVKLQNTISELEERRKLASNQLNELERLHQQHKDTLKELEKMKTAIRQLPESVIVESAEYKNLQSKFSVLYNEFVQMKAAVQKARTQLQNEKDGHLKQIDKMEIQELETQRELRTEMIRLTDVLSQCRNEYEMMRREFQEHSAANEQMRPINAEMRLLITSLQSYNQQLKRELHNYKRKCKEASQELNDFQKNSNVEAAQGGEGSDENLPTIKIEELGPEDA